MWSSPHWQISHLIGMLLFCRGDSRVFVFWQYECMFTCICFFKSSSRKLFSTADATSDLMNIFSLNEQWKLFGPSDGRTTLLKCLKPSFLPGFSQIPFSFSLLWNSLSISSLLNWALALSKSKSFSNFMGPSRRTLKRPLPRCPPPRPRRLAGAPAATAAQSDRRHQLPDSSGGDGVTTNTPHGNTWGSKVNQSTSTMAEEHELVKSYSLLQMLASPPQNKITSNMEKIIQGHSQVWKHHLTTSQRRLSIDMSSMSICTHVH